MALWSRRNFLKAGVLGTAGIALEAPGRALAPGETRRSAGERALRKFRDPVPTVCRVCPAHCGASAFRDGDRVVQLLGARGSPTNRGLCPRAWSALERLYDPDRVRVPLRRRGPRGSGEWEPISWEAALSELRARLGAGGRNVLHLGREDVLVEELRSELGLSEVLVDEPASGRPGPASGEAVYGAPALRPDVRGARTILLLGVHALEGRGDLPFAGELLAARAEGAALHLVDALQGVTGSLAAWHPVVPGAEAAVGFGIARLLLAEGGYAEGFGRRVTEAPETLLRALSAYTPEAVERAAGLSPPELAALAQVFAGGGPSVAWAEPGTAAAVAAALVNQLTGAVGAPGGVALARAPAFAAPLRTRRRAEAWFQELAEGEGRADLYWAVDANPAGEAPEAGAVTRALGDPDRVGFLVAFETHLTETARLADLFLPWATPLESWGLAEGSLPDGRSYLFLQQPVTPGLAEPARLKAFGTEQRFLFEPRRGPLGDARSLPDVLLALARESRTFGRFSGTEAWLEETLRRTRGPGSLDALRLRGVWVSDDAPEPAARAPVSFGAAIPPLDAAASAGEGLFLVGYPEGTLPRSYPRSPRGREAAHGPAALLHPHTARRRGLSDGDLLRLRTTRGEAFAPVRVVQGIHPRAVALPEGPGRGPASLRALVPFQTGPAGLREGGPVPVEIGKG